MSPFTFSIRLNSNGLCFICLRDTKVIGGADSPPPSFRLRNIIRFLGIDTKEIFEAYLDYDLRRCSDTEVELCEGCSEEVRKFNCLYQTLELTKLKLNECARKISNLMTEAEAECDNDGDRKRVVQAAIKGVIVDLRAGISGKCLELSETVPPRVLLNRLPEDELAQFYSRGSATTGSHTISQPEIRIEVPVPEEDDESMIFTDTAASQINDFGSAPVISQPGKRTVIKLGFKTKSPRRIGKFPCPSCKAVFVNNPDLQRHLVMHHLQTHFFPEEEHKEPSLSSHQFNEVVHHLLFKNIFTENPVTDVVSRCPHCSKTFHKDRPGIFRLHLLRNHKPSLIQKLKELQTDPTLLEQLSKIPNSWVCKCGDHFANQITYQHHRNFSCNLNEKPLKEKGRSLAMSKSILEFVHQQKRAFVSKSANGIHQATCPHCKAVIKTKVLGYLKFLLEHHLASHHIHTYFPEDKHKESSLTSYQFKQVLHRFLFKNISRDRDPKIKDRYNYKCPHCKMNSVKTSLNLMRVHLIRFHYTFLAQRLEELQKDPLIFENLEKIPEAFICKCGDYFKSKKVFKLHRKKICKLKGNHVGSSSSKPREIVSSTCKTERDAMELEVEEMFEGDADDHFSNSEDLYSVDVGDLKPSISLVTNIGEEGIGTTEWERRGSGMESDSNSSGSDIPLKIRIRNRKRKRRGSELDDSDSSSSESDVPLKLRMRNRERKWMGWEMDSDSSLSESEVPLKIRMRNRKLNRSC